MSFVYLMHDTSTGWMKFGWSGSPFTRLHQVRKSYPELAHAELVGCVKTAYFMELELFIGREIEHQAREAGGSVCGERFKWDCTDPQALLMTAYEFVADADQTAAVWCHVRPRPPKKARKQPREPSAYFLQRLAEIRAA